LILDKSPGDLTPGDPTVINPINVLTTECLNGRVMTKADLIDSLARRAELPRQKAEEIVNGFLDDIVAALKNGDKINVSGFGTFSISERKGRTGRNPKTGETIEIAPSRVAKFKAGKVLKEALS
jgi:DNA-binding protein HU-beta